MFFNCSTCFGRNTAHHKELKNCNCSLWFYIRFWLPVAAAITVFELLMMGGVLPETCWAIKKHWNNKFYYMVASCCFFPWGLVLIALKLGAILRRAVSFMARVFYPRGYIYWKPFRRRVCGSKCHSGHLVESKNPFPLPEIERHFLSLPARGIVNCASWDNRALILITDINILIVSKQAKYCYWWLFTDEKRCTLATVGDTSH